MNFLYGDLPADDFGPLKMKTVRQLLIDGYDHPKYGRQTPCSRRANNGRMNRVRFLFRWAAENELVSASVYHGLLTVQGLQRGRSDARETKPVTPVPESLVNAIRPFVGRQVRALFDLQLLTGARPGELVIMRAIDVDTSARIWVYIPESHKNEHRGHRREILLGPRAQEIVKTFLKSDPEAYLFSAAEAEAERKAQRRQNRKTPLYPSSVRRMEKKRKRNRERAPRDHYDVASYRRAIARACETCYPLPENIARKIANGKRENLAAWRARLMAEEKEAVQQWRRDHQRHPHQLRHNAATNLRKEYGVEATRIILGHKNAFTTEIYAETDRTLAMEVIDKCG